MSEFWLVTFRCDGGGGTDTEAIDFHPVEASAMWNREFPPKALVFVMPITKEQHEEWWARVEGRYVEPKP